jgi:hypothetical protein
MNELRRIIPDVQMLLALTPEELAEKMLFLLKKRNEAKFHTGNLQKELWGHYTSGQPQYPRQHENEINLALSEAWAWLQADFKSFKVANLLPKEILHPKIADPVRLLY